MLDLHTHSSASDGADTPRELVRQAKERGLKGMALTDHDTCAGLEEAFAAGLELGLWVLPGVELSAEWGDEDVHILGYWISTRHRELTDLMIKLRADRAGRMARIVGRLGELGLTISLSEVNAQSDGDGYSLGRPHIARALVARGYVSSIGEAFDLYLERGRPACVPRYKLSPEEAIGAIVRSGGVAVQAILILMVVGTLIGLWILSGTIPAMIYYGLQILSPTRPGDLLIAVGADSISSVQAPLCPNFFKRSSQHQHLEKKGYPLSSSLF